MELYKMIDLFLKQEKTDCLQKTSFDDIRNVRNVTSRASSTCETKVSWGMLDSEVDEVEIGSWKKK